MFYSSKTGLVVLAAFLLLAATVSTSAQAQSGSGIVQGIKWHDMDCDGHIPYGSSGEGGLSNWTIYLDLNANAQLDSGEPTTVTDIDGDYRFDNLSNGTYVIREVEKSGWTLVFPAAGSYTVTITDTDSIHRPLDFGSNENSVCRQTSPEPGPTPAPEPMPSPSPSGGSGGGGGPAPTGIIPTPALAPSPVPTPVPSAGQVLGADTENGEGMGGAEELPRTGSPLTLTALLLTGALAAYINKSQALKNKA